MQYLYGENLKLKNKVFIVEGVLDVISVNRTGHSALATFTKQFSESQLNKLKDFVETGRCKEFVIMLDADAEDRSDLLEYELSLIGCKANQIKLDRDDPGEMNIEELSQILS
jgi:5S rRNA maturation endonuclease (ribonuclease M5)